MGTRTSTEKETFCVKMANNFWKKKKQFFAFVSNFFFEIFVR